MQMDDEEMEGEEDDGQNQQIVDINTQQMWTKITKFSQNIKIYLNLSKMHEQHQSLIFPYFDI